MDNMNAYQLKNADPKYTAFDQKIRDAHQEKRRINAKQCVAMRMCQLNHALDLVAASPGTSSQHLPRLTRCWKNQQASMVRVGSGHHNAGEEMEKTMIQKCIKVANLAANYDVCSERISALIAKQKEYGDKLVQQHKAQEAKVMRMSRTTNDQRRQRLQGLAQ